MLLSGYEDDLEWDDAYAECCFAFLYFYFWSVSVLGYFNCNWV